MKSKQIKKIKKAGKAAKNDKYIPVCFISDDGYVIPTATAIQSLIQNKKAETHYDIYIISPSLSQKSIERFKLFSSCTVKINIIQSSMEKYSNLHHYYKKTFCVATPAALLKFEIPNFLASYNKAIYLDGDILVKKDLSDLWNVDVDKYYVAAVYDTGRLYSKNEKFALYPQYFNSGVMLLNLNLLRKNNIPEKLYEAKKNSLDMSLMDQNIFNQVLKEKIKNIDIVFNYLVINLHRAVDKYAFQDINNLFHSKYLSLEDIEDKAYILHFSSKDKPWKYYNGEYSEVWYEYFMRCPFNDEIIKRVWKNSALLENSAIKRDNKELIISLTSYPARIETVNQTIVTLLDQTLPADKVVLWLAPEQFPNREADLPRQLLDLTDKGLTIDWYHDIKSYKKLIPTLKKYPEAIIVTADDDILYPQNWLQKLYTQYQLNPDIISSQRCHHIEFENNKILPYRKWRHQISTNVAEYSNFPTCGGGVLYPPNCFHNDVLNEDFFMKICPNADDIWFWGQLILNDKKICTVPDNIKKLSLIQGSQETALWKSNVISNQNDVQLNSLIKKYPKILKILQKEQHQEQHGQGKSYLKSYLLFPYYLLAVGVLRKKKARLLAEQELAKRPKQKVDKNRISIKLLKCLPIFTYKNSGGKKVWKFFGLPLFKKRTTDGGKNIKFYVFGVNVMQYSKKTTKVLR